MTRITIIKLSSIAVEMLPIEAQQAVPKAGDAVRMEEVQGFFELTPLSDKQTKVVFQLHLNPGGGLPASLVNALIVDNPFETLKALAVQVGKPEYANFNPF